MSHPPETPKKHNFAYWFFDKYNRLASGGIIADGIGRLKEQKEKGKYSVNVYIMTHNSDWDWIKFGIELYRNMLPLPKISADKVFRHWWTGWLENLGAVIAGRQGGVVGEFNRLVWEGNDAGVFVEETRNYSGKRGEVKSSLAISAVRACKRRDVYMWPVAIVHETPPEDGRFARLMATGEKAGANGHLWDLLFRWNRESRTYIDIGESVHANKFLESYAGHRIDAAQELTARLFEQAARIYRVVPTALVAASIEDAGRSEISAIEEQAYINIETLVERGANLKAFGNCNGAEIWEALNRGLHMLEKRGALRHDEARVELRNPRMVKYYANTIRHLLGEKDDA